MLRSAYDLMDWTEVEAVVYGEENQPRQILGPKVVKEGVLIQCFFPGCDKVNLCLDDNQVFEMEEEDEEGYYAILIPNTTIPCYQYEVSYGKEKRMFRDAYAFDNQITKEEEAMMLEGTCFYGFEKLGAHPMTLNGVSGVYFAVWAPNAIRVSVVGDFNQWDGRRYQMNRLATTGVFELFIPDIRIGDLYKYEIKGRNGVVFLKTDPYGHRCELRPKTASIVEDISSYVWEDEKFMDQRKSFQSMEKPMFIYELHMGSFRKPKDKEFYNYRELAPMIIDYVREMGYTHVELMPVMEHPYDPSWGYQVTGYYAPTSRYGSSEDFMYFIDQLHQAEIGVIIDWVPAHFPRDAHGLAWFDGTCLYEHEDPRKGAHPHWGTLIFNYGSPFVVNFLVGNALYWAKYYHIDGIRMDAVASMLYLDYGRNYGEWIPNEFGGNENLEAITFLQTLNSVMYKEFPDVLLIAEESTAWPMVTGDRKDGGLGFDYKWNMGWMNDFIHYMSLEPLFRGGNHSCLTFSMVYHHSERFLLSLSHDEVVHGKGTLLMKMPGNQEQKFANLRLAYGSMITHPGKKLLFMGQDFAQTKEWDFNGELCWEEKKCKEHQEFVAYTKDLIALYKDTKALYNMDYDSRGFQWINETDTTRSVTSYLRNTDKKEECVLVVCNYSAVAYEKFQVGVPYSGKYKEVLNSDHIAYGGEGIVNPRVKSSKAIPCDGMQQSITIKVPPLGISIFQYKKVEKKVTKKQV